MKNALADLEAGMAYFQELEARVAQLQEEHARLD